MRTKNVLHLGVKELWSLARDPIMLLLIVFAFTVSIYSTASSLPDSLYKAPIAIVDEDQSAAVAADRQRLPAAPVPAAEAGVAGGDGRPDGRRAGHLRPQHPPQLPAGRAGRALAPDPAQHRRDPRRPGVQRQRLRADDRDGRGADVVRSATGAPPRRRWWRSRTGCGSTRT